MTDLFGMNDASPQCRNAELPIGVFDSGVGGLTVVRAIRAALPHEDLVYLGDTARTPYGTKSPSTIVRFSCEDVQFLREHKVKAVIIGCSTVSAWALSILKKRFPVPIFDVILPGVLAALEQTSNQRIGVIGTNATVRSLAYTRTILANCRTAKVFEAGCRLLVPLVEEGWMEHRATRLIVREYLAPLRRRRIDTLLLACTHFPLLKDTIRQVVGDKISLVDCAEMSARFARERLEELGLLCRKRRRPGVFQAFVTDEPERFTKLAARFLGEQIDPALEISLAPL
jgi:glutamate racemase